MIIRSQAKESIWNFNNVDCIHISVDNVGCYIKVYVNDNSISIGHYSTDEKAIKVLDMIQEKFLQYGTIERGFSTESVFVIPRCFQMPQDSEV